MSHNNVSVASSVPINILTTSTDGSKHIAVVSSNVLHPQTPENDETQRTLSATNRPITTPMRIRKRDGTLQEVSFDKILWRLRTLSDGLDVDYTSIAQDAVAGLKDDIKSSEIDCLTANIAHQRHSDHPDYDILASRIIISNHHKETIGYELFSQVIWELHESGQINDKFYEVVQENAAELDNAIDYDKDFYLSYFGFKTFERTYGMKINQKVVERPQHMFMRVALAIWMSDIERAIETYEWMSSKYFTHASPSLFNAGGIYQQMSSCFLVAMKDDSIKGIFDTLSQCANISKTGGGLGMHCSNIRSNGELIKSCGMNGVGLVPMLKGYEWMTKYVDQGRKRQGAMAVYLEPWHPDIFDFLDLKKKTGPVERRTFDLHLAMWIPDLFMKRVKEDGIWTLMNIVKCPGLQDAYGDAFNELYTKYERELTGTEYVKQVRAQDLYKTIITSQIENGEPYMLYKDHVNRKSNQMNIGTIRSSNLCAEILLYSDADNTAVCNLASIALPSFVRYKNEGTVKKPYFDFKTLIDVTRIVTRNLNRVIDINYYPTVECERSNKRDRPIGIGVQGLADTFVKMRYTFDSNEASKLNKQIFETMYFAALSESCALSKVEGPYKTFEGSPLSKGKFQFDLWKECGTNVELSGTLDWERLRRQIKQYGVRNSTLLAVMPTASTSQLLGFNESIEAFTSNFYTRTTNAGTFKIITKQLIYDLIDAGIWNKNTAETLKQKIIFYEGAIQQIAEIPQHIKELYKTGYDMKQSIIIDQSADRAPFIDQTQSLNIFIRHPTVSQMSSLHMYAWGRGLKTGMYYLRSEPSKSAVKVAVDFQLEKELQSQNNPQEVRGLVSSTRQSSSPSTDSTTTSTKNDANPSAEEIVAPASPPRNDTESWVCNRQEGCLSCGS